jgi:DGQHR domain-containing protein
MRNLENNIIHGTRVVQNKQDFIISVFSIKQILTFTKYTKRLIVSYDELGHPIYNDEIQRHVENPRVKKISDFLINDPDATFPTNLVLHIPEEIILEQHEKDDRISIVLDKSVFKEIQKEEGNVFITIIDGQHRIKGIELAISELKLKITDLNKTLNSSSNENLEKKREYYINRLDDLTNIQMVVTFFVDKTLEYQAMIFSTINRTQKKVSADLVSSLFGLNNDDTPQKTSLQTVLSLNSHPNSPFYKRIKLYGGNYSRENSPPLSQASMVRSIISLISEDIRSSETDRYKKRKELLNLSSGSKKFLPFRKFYALDQDHKISDTFFYYFNSVRNTFKDKDGLNYWDIQKGEPKNIFHTTVGYDSLLKVLLEILSNEKITSPTSTDDFDKILLKSSNLIIDNQNRYSFNNRGKKFLYLDMSLAIFPSDYISNPKDNREKELRLLIKG